MSCAETAEPLDLPFGLWIWVGQRKHEFSRICCTPPHRGWGLRRVLCPSYGKNFVVVVAVVVVVRSEVLFCIRLHFSLYCSWHKSMKSCQNIPKCQQVVLMLQYYIRCNGIGTYYKTICMNSAKYGLMFVLSESEKNFWMLFTETGLL